MGDYKCISLDSKSDWAKALNGVKHSFAHTWGNCYSMSLTTKNKTFLFSYENEEVMIICPIAEREYVGIKDIVTPYGFSGFTGNGDCKDFFNSWNDFVRKNNYVCGYISLNPLLQNDNYYDVKDAFVSTSLYFIDLRLSLTELYEKLDANRKKLIKNYRKFEAEFIYDRNLLTDFFIDNYYDFLKRINASSANYFSKETLEYLCSLENIYMVGAGTGKKIDAVYIFGHTEYIADCLFNVANAEGREYSPLLLWCGLKFFRKKKIPVLNLGGGIREDDSVALSKQRFGAYKLPFINLKQVYNKEIYESLCLKKGIDPEDRSEYFPAYRKV